jgi:alpha-amylase
VARIGVEWAITMLGGGGNPDAWWEVGGTRTRHDAVGGAAGVERLAQGNGWLATHVDTTVSPAADAWYAPIETVSNSEAGFERVYQGSALLLSWTVNVAPGGSWSATIEHRAKVGADRLAEEQTTA